MARFGAQRPSRARREGHQDGDGVARGRFGQILKNSGIAETEFKSMHHREREQLSVLNLHTDSERSGAQFAAVATLRANMWRNGLDTFKKL